MSILSLGAKARSASLLDAPIPQFIIRAFGRQEVAMRRGLAAILYLAILGGTASNVFGQYPYPYPPPGYGPMPYGPPPTMMQPRQPYYPPARQWQPPPPPAPTPTVFVYGPLTGPTHPVAAIATQPGGDDTPMIKSNVAIAQETTSESPLYPTGIRSMQIDPEGCGPFGCPDDGPHGRTPPVRGHGRFIGEVGAYFLVPFYGNRQAYSTTVGTTNTASNFPRVMDAGPRTSVGYLFHSGFGFRANYWYLHAAANQSISNGDAGTTLATPTPLPIISPSATLQQGMGADQFTFGQSVNVNVVDAEMLKECHVFDNTFLLSFGARYAQVHQLYSATRTNVGGDFESLTTGSRFAGFGPTTSLEFIHRLGSSNVSFYASGRASFLFGVDRFTQDYQGAVNTTYESDTRCATIVEAEMGLQYGCNVGCCYLFVRAGGVYQRWFEVGTPVGSNGDLTFVGGTARVGIVY
jgi:hypothetical protein